MSFENSVSAEQIDGWGLAQCLKAQRSKSLFFKNGLNDSTHNHQQAFKDDMLNERNVHPVLKVKF